MSKKSSAISFILTPEELEVQVSEYSTLKFWKTARGACILFFASINLLTVGVTYFTTLADMDFLDSIIDTLLHLPLYFFIYKGHKWAIIGLALLWLVTKVSMIYWQLTSGHGNLIVGIIFLILGLALCSRALQAENARRKITAT